VLVRLPDGVGLQYQMLYHAVGKRPDQGVRRVDVAAIGKFDLNSPIHGR
jgi:hypothetical protein